MGLISRLPYLSFWAYGPKTLDSRTLARGPSGWTDGAVFIIFFLNFGGIWPKTVIFQRSQCIISCLGISITYWNHISINDNLFIPSTWKNRMLNYWNIDSKNKNILFKLSKTPSNPLLHHSITPLFQLGRRPSVFIIEKIQKLQRSFLVLQKFYKAKNQKKGQNHRKPI